MDAREPDVAAEDAAALARQAGLRIAAEQLPQFAAELTAARQLIADLERVDMADVPPVPGPFDAAWPDQPGARR